MDLLSDLDDRVHRQIQRVVDAACAEYGADCAAIYRIDAAGAVARWTCGSGRCDSRTLRHLRRLRIEEGRGSLGAVLSADGPQVLDRRVLPRLLGTELEFSAAAAPLRGVTARVWGILVLFMRGCQELDAARLARLSGLASEAATAIELGALAERFRDADARHRFLLDRLPDVIWAAGADRVFTYVSAGAKAMLGYEPAELIGHSSDLVMHESSREAFEAGFRWQVAHPDSDQTYRVNLRHKDGHAVPVELHNIGTPMNGGYGGGTGSVRETSERDRLERELRTQAEELAATRERAHLAQELHDSVTQALFSIAMTAGAARRLLAEDSPGVREKLDELSALAHEGLAEMRSLIFELRPGNVRQEGFVPAVTKHLSAVGSRTGLAVRLDVQPDLPRISPDVEDALYRIMQEALHNIVKHARARTAHISISSEGGTVRLQVSDDGVGFDASRQSSGLGLNGIRARIERFGGSLTLQSMPGQGSQLSATMPALWRGDE